VTTFLAWKQKQAFANGTKPAVHSVYQKKLALNVQHKLTRVEIVEDYEVANVWEVG